MRVSGCPLVAETGDAVGARLNRLDGDEKVLGLDRFGDDVAAAATAVIQVIRSPHHRAAFEIGDLEKYVTETPGLIRVLTASDVPGRNLHGVIPQMADQPVFAEAEARFRGEAIAAVVGEAVVGTAVVGDVVVGTAVVGATVVAVVV